MAVCGGPGQVLPLLQEELGPRSSSCSLRSLPAHKVQARRSRTGGPRAPWHERGLRGLARAVGHRWLRALRPGARLHTRHAAVPGRAAGARGGRGRGAAGRLRGRGGHRAGVRAGGHDVPGDRGRRGGRAACGRPLRRARRPPPACRPRPRRCAPAAAPPARAARRCTMAARRSARCRACRRTLCSGARRRRRPRWPRPSPRTRPAWPARARWSCSWTSRCSGRRRRCGRRWTRRRPGPPAVAAARPWCWPTRRRASWSRGRAPRRRPAARRWLGIAGSCPRASRRGPGAHQLSALSRLCFPPVQRDGPLLALPAGQGSRRGA